MNIQKSFLYILITLLTLNTTGCFLDFKKKDISQYNFNAGTFFDGQSMIQVPTQAHYKIEAWTPYTIEATIKADSSQLPYPTIISSRDEGGFTKGILINLWDKLGVLSMYLGAKSGGNICHLPDSLKGIVDDRSSSYTSSPNLKDNQWHHIVITRATHDWEMYIDGELVCERPVKHPIDFNIALNIGGDRASRYNTYFHGYIKDVKIWTSYTSDIHELIHRNVTGGEQDLLGYWPLNPSLPNPLIDLSQNKSHGVWSK